MVQISIQPRVCLRETFQPTDPSPTPAATPSPRAIKEACRLAGTANTGGGTAAIVFPASPGFAVSSTALVISSTKRGMPSVRSMMSRLMLSGRDLLPVTWSISAAVSRSPRRLRLSAVTYGLPSHGGSNSDRYVMMSSTGKVFRRSIVRPSASSDGWVEPMHVLENHQHRVGPREQFQLRGECF